MARPALSLRAKLLVFGNCAGHAAASAALSVHFLYFLTDVVGLAASLGGTLMLVGRIFDGLNDPVVGVISDRTRSRWGRRRFFVLFGAVPLGLVCVPLWTVPELEPQQKFVWMLIAFMIFDTFFTLVHVPAKSWEMEMTFDYHERIRLGMFSGLGGVVGYLGGAAVFPWVVALADIPKHGYRTAGLLLGVFSCLVALALGVFLREVPRTTRVPPKRFSFDAYRSTFRNGPFYRLQASFVLARVAFTLWVAAMPYYCAHWLKDRSLLPKTMAALVVMVGLFLPFWRMVALRAGKARTFSVGLLVTGLAVAALYLVPPDGAWLAVVVAGVIGSGVSVQWGLPSALVADTLDFDERISGERREGLYVGIAAICDRSAAALGIVALGWGLAAFGYVAGDASVAALSPAVLVGIRMFVGLIPAALLVFSAVIAWFHPLDHAAHRQVRERIEAAKVERSESGL